MSVSDEIEKLASLRNQGLITEREYQDRKKKLLRAGIEPGAPTKPRPWYKSWWLRVPVALAGAAGLGFTVLGGMTRLPDCDSAEAFDLVKRTVENSPLGRSQGLSVVELSGVMQPNSSNGSDKRSCIAVATLNNAQRLTIHYQFTWASSKKQQIEVSVQYM